MAYKSHLRAAYGPLAAFDRWRRTRRARNIGTIGLVLLGPVLALATFLIIGPLGQGASSRSLRLILLADLVYILTIAALVMAQIVRLFAARRSKSAYPACIFV